MALPVQAERQSRSSCPCRGMTLSTSLCARATCPCVWSSTAVPSFRGMLPRDPRQRRLWLALQRAGDNTNGSWSSSVWQYVQGCISRPAGLLVGAQIWMSRMGSNGLGTARQWGSDGSCRGGGSCAAWKFSCAGEAMALHNCSEDAGGL